MSTSVHANSNSLPGLSYNIFANSITVNGLGITTEVSEITDATTEASGIPDQDDTTTAPDSVEVSTIPSVVGTTEFIESTTFLTSGNLTNEILIPLFLDNQFSLPANKGWTK